jgi:hypothetical protein
VVGQFLLHLGFGILDTLRIYYHLSLEAVRSLAFLVQGIPLLSFSSDDGETRTARGGPLRRALLNNGGSRSGGSNISNGLPPLWTPEEEEEDGEEESGSNNNNGLGGPLHPPSSSPRAVAMEEDANHHHSASSDGEYSNSNKLPRQRANTKREGSNGTTTTTTTTTPPPDGLGKSHPRNGQNLASASTRTRRTTMGTTHISSPSHPVSRHGDIEPAFLNDQDYPPGWLVYHPVLGVVPKEEADKYDAEKWQQQQQGQSHSHSHSHSHSPGNDRPVFQSSITA